MGLTVLGAREQGDEGEVLFFAKVFQRGADHSFIELSSFERHDGTWGYRSGILSRHPAGQPLPEGLTLDSAPALLAASNRKQNEQE